MFTLSAKASYGLTAMLDLAGRRAQGPVQIKDIAEPNGIPQHYLEQILAQLRKAGVVESYRGAQGGYALARKPGEISVREILARLDGPLEVVPDGRSGTVLDFFWTGLEREIDRLLDISLEELQLRRQRAEGQFTYTI